MLGLGHFDLGAKDLARAIVFYKAAFVWTTEKWNGCVRALPHHDGRSVRGRHRRRSDANDRQWHRCNPDLGRVVVGATLAAVVAAGGSIVGEVADIPSVGCMVSGKDTEGNVFGQKESGQHVEPRELSRV